MMNEVVWRATLTQHLSQILGCTKDPKGTHYVALKAPFFVQHLLFELLSSPCSILFPHLKGRSNKLSPSL